MTRPLRTASAIVVLALAGCGARTDLASDRSDGGTTPTIDASPVLDVGVAVRVDAGARDADVDPPDGGQDAWIGVDAGPPIECPERGEVGYRVVELGRLEVERDFAAISLGGDGRSVYLATHDDAPYRAVRLYQLTGVDATARELTEVLDASRPRVAVDDGVARMISLEYPLILVEARDGAAAEVGRTEIFHASRLEPQRPVWNGSDVIVVGSTGFFGPLTLGAESLPWRSYADGSPIGVAAQSSTGRTELLRRVYTTEPAYVVESFDRDGMLLGAVTLDSPEYWNSPAFGWLDADGGAQPLVLAGFMQAADGTARATLQRFRPDGSAAGGFSAPVPTGYGNVDLTTVAVPPHASGYGMIASPSGGPTLFHGAGEGFVGDARELPWSCYAVSIAAGPCGYVLACLGADGVQLALAIPPNP